jgi:hypothetical protein
MYYRYENKRRIMENIDQNAGKNHNIKIDNTSFGRVKGVKYLGTTLKHPNSIHEEIKSRLMSGNACYHSAQNLLSSRLLSKNAGNFLAS